MLAITSFTGEHRFLSNFFAMREDEPIRMGSMVFPTVEHAYQASKTWIEDERERIRCAITPGRAKRLGQHVTLAPNWEARKVREMRGLLRQKFNYPRLSALLLATGNAELVEGNHWGDTFWGQCPVGTGLNTLGKLLMEVRDDLA